jgi:hypothetical protein
METLNFKSIIDLLKTFPTWLESKYPEKSKEFKYYKHVLPDGKEVEARQYKNEILPLVNKINNFICIIFCLFTLCEMNGNLII